ncbi:MAG: HIT domain-containing protein [Thermoleophilia bacterium]|jgi:histidine triad (HIT) family protein|nr:HIT domain-containing protein [Thermoleophilia bacterium]TFG73689.1 MAG: HIT domain-containing protein [Solirubrobacterales bacterium]
MSPPDCIFCAIVAGAAPAEVLDSDEHTISFMDINPATPGHALVIPRRHSKDLIEINSYDLRHTIAASQRLTLRMAESLKPAGFNLINASGAAAWQTVFHFHVHVIPRYEDDPLKLPWIPRGAEMDEIARIAAQIRGDE